jgi:HK97 family phage prohead protease
MRRPIGLNRLNIAKDGSLLTEMELNLEVQEAKELLALMRQFHKNKRPMELSIGYRATEYSFGDHEKERVRFLEKVDVHEVSVVPFGMNQGSQITAVKDKKIQEVTDENDRLKKEIDRLKKENEVMDSKIKTMTILGGK